MRYYPPKKKPLNYFERQQKKLYPKKHHYYFFDYMYYCGEKWSEKGKGIRTSGMIVLFSYWSFCIILPLCMYLSSVSIVSQMVGISLVCSFFVLSHRSYFACYVIEPNAVLPLWFIIAVVNGVKEFRCGWHVQCGFRFVYWNSGYWSGWAGFQHKVIKSLIIPIIILALCDLVQKMD